MTIDFPQNNYKGLIFDLDGTLVDSMPLHFEAWCLALEKHGAPGILPEDAFYAMGGIPTIEIVKQLNAEHGLTLDPKAVALSKREAFMANLEQVQVIKPIVDFVKCNHGSVPMSVATGGTRHVAEQTLQALGLSDLFEGLVTANDVSQGKPNPEVFLKAADLIGIAPEDCVAFEDAVPGIQAAEAAGMKVVVIPAPSRVIL